VEMVKDGRTAGQRFARYLGRGFTLALVFQYDLYLMGIKRLWRQ
jgi:hypothetical protein